MTGELEEEADRNYDALMARLGSLLPARRGEWALMRHGEIAGYFPDESRALACGRQSYGDGVYSIQQITDRTVDLGFYSHAIDPRLA